MEIKQATEKTNKREIAGLIYDTDPYIYPFWFGSKRNSIKTLCDMIGREGNIFYYKNIIVAEDNGHVLGIMVKLDENSIMNDDLNWLRSVNNNYAYTIDNYIGKMREYVKKDFIYISNVCVKKTHRRHHIAQSMFNYLFYNNKKSVKYELDVLADNPPAVALYKKMGFEKVSEQDGFNAADLPKPLVYTMVRKENIR